MQNLMNKDFYPEDMQETILCNKIKEIKNSEEISKFLKDVEYLLKDKTEIFAYRIKEPFSAIRTYRLANYKNANKLHDLIGILIVVDKVEEIENIEKIIKEKVEVDNIKIYNLLNEKEFELRHYKKLKDVEASKYNELIFEDISKWIYIPNDLNILLPPFSYNMLCKKKFNSIDYEIPIEIRIQTKEDFITTESYYYTIHKNDNLQINVKIPLLCMSFRILRRMSNIAFEDNIEMIEKYKREIEQIKNENIDFIEENKENFEYVLSEHSKIINCWKNKLDIYQFKRN